MIEENDLITVGFLVFQVIFLLGTGVIGFFVKGFITKANDKFDAHDEKISSLEKYVLAQEVNINSNKKLSDQSIELQIRSIEKRFDTFETNISHQFKSLMKEVKNGHNKVHSDSFNNS